MRCSDGVLVDNMFRITHDVTTIAGAIVLVVPDASGEPLLEFMPRHAATDCSVVTTYYEPVPIYELAKDLCMTPHELAEHCVRIGGALFRFEVDDARRFAESLGRQ